MDTVLDRQRGIANINGNEQLYDKLLEEFCTNHGTDAKKIRTALEVNDFTTAQRIAHTLKGVSGTLGAECIRSIATQTDTALKRNQRPGGANLAELDACLRRLVSIVQQQTAAAKSSSEAYASLNQSAFARMRDMLEQMNPAAEDLAISMAPALSHLDPETVSRLIDQVKGFEFEEALESLARLERAVE